MLELNDPLWSELSHAYGSANDIPELLKNLALGSSNSDKIWFNLWSALAHQGDVYQASFAAVPHIVERLADGIDSATFNSFAFVSWVEICRLRHGIAVEPNLRAAYEAALAQMPGLAVRVPPKAQSMELASTALSAIAVAWSFPELGEAILDMDSETLPEFRVWMENR